MIRAAGLHIGNRARVFGSVLGFAVRFLTPIFWAFWARGACTPCKTKINGAAAPFWPFMPLILGARRGQKYGLRSEYSLSKNTPRPEVSAYLQG
jgi:hypothetical protein